MSKTKMMNEKKLNEKDLIHISLDHFINEEKIFL
jgi:hypothetical protein